MERGPDGGGRVWKEGTYLVACGKKGKVVLAKRDWVLCGEEERQIMWPCVKNELAILLLVSLLLISTISFEACGPGFFGYFQWLVVWKMM